MREAPPADAFTIARTVEPAHLDENRHVNNVVYVQWVQDAAIAHWRALAPEAAQRELGWVALRHEVDYAHPAMLGDAIAIRTWVGQADGLAFERFVEIRRASDQRLLAKARTLWCPVDARTMRPRRPSAELRALFSIAG